MEDLNDPFGDRVMKNVPPLARFPLRKDEIWHESGRYYVFNAVNTVLERIQILDFLVV